MPKVDILVSVVAVIRDHSRVLPDFVREASALLDVHFTNHEILLVDNGSSDETEAVVRKLLGGFPFIRYLRLTRPVDEETAMMAGLDSAIGDYVVTIDPDFDPPAELVLIIEECRGGKDLVLGVNSMPGFMSPVYRALRAVFLTTSRRLLNIEIVTGTTGLRAISRQAVNALVKVRLRRSYFAVVVADVGLKTSLHKYRRISRSGRQPRRNILRAVRTGLSVLIHNSITPLRIASFMGLAGSLLSLAYSCYVIIVFFFKADVMPGWTTLSLAMSGLFAMAFLMLALMGEYLGRLLEESIHRPLYHVRDELSSSILLVESTRRNVLDQSEVLQRAEEKP